MAGVLNVGTGYKRIVAAGMAGLGMTLGALMLTGKLFAAFPLAGIGGFVITAPHIAGTTFSLTPSLTATDQQQGWPAGMISIASMNIDKGFQLTKHFDMSATPIGKLIPSADVNIVASTVNGNNILMDTTGLQAGSATFGTFNAYEQYAVMAPGATAGPYAGVEGSTTLTAGPNGALDPTKQMGLAAGTLDLTDAAINADALTSSSITLGTMKLEVIANVYNPSNGTTTPYGNFGYDSKYNGQSYNPANVTP